MRTHKKHVFKGKDGKYYWHVKAGNGEIVAGGTQGFTRKDDAHKSFLKLVPAFLEIFINEKL